MQPSISTRVTIEDLYALPDDGTRYELQGGRLLAEPLPGFRHGRIVARLAALLEVFARRRGLGVVLAADAGYALARSPDTLRGPDVSFVTRQRFEPVGDTARVFPGPPDLAVEVVSPHDRPADLHAKVADYLAAGTRLVWVVDPDSETVTVYRSLLEPRTLRGEERLAGEDVLPGFAAPVGKLFEI